MKQTLTAEDIKNIIRLISQIMDEQKDELCRLDGALGDGDIGLTLSKGFRVIVEKLPDMPEDNVGSIFRLGALTMGETVASTMGTLLSSALLRASKVSEGKQALAAEELLEVAQAMIDGIAARGKAKVGDKTILDAWVPATEAMASAIQAGQSLSEAIHAAYAAAQEGADQTIGMQSRHGRAGRYLERSIGLKDPGAAAGALIWQAFFSYMRSMDGAEGSSGI